LDRRDQVQRAVAEGHEIAMYSDDRGSHGEMSIEERRLGMERSLDVLAGIAGLRPVGHKSAGWQDNESTHRVAQEMGLQWIMDIPNGDFPSFVQPEPSRPPLVNLPPSWMQDD